MASAYIPVSFQRLWSIWNIRGFMIMSLTVQSVLSLTAPLRPKTSNIFIIFVVWSAYFLADWTAIFAIGLISNTGCSKSPTHVMVSNDLRALWASFLLIHLGGPDNITAFSFEDNALWLRHLVGLIAQVFAFAYIFAKTLPDNKLMATTILVFVAGVINYGDRTRSLYLASFYNFKETSIELLNEGDNVDLSASRQYREANPEEKLKWVLDFFRILRGLIVDIMPNQLKWCRSQDFFLQLDADSAFEIMATELNLLYEVFYTKILAANSTWGVLIRNIAWYLSVAAFVSFYINKKEDMHSTDIWITYALFAGVIALDTSSDIMLTSSKWTSIRSRYLGLQIFGRCLFPFLISVMLYAIVNIILYACGCGHVMKRLWSNKMGSFNLLVYSFEEGRPRKGCALSRCCAVIGYIAEKIGVAEEIAKCQYASKVNMDNGIWEFTFKSLKRRASIANKPDQVREIFEARGELALQESLNELVLQESSDESSLQESVNELIQYVTKFEYDQSAILWHIATEICYNTDQNPDRNNQNKKFSKIFSDYMIYLLVKQPNMMSAVSGIFHKSYRDTCSKLKSLEERFQKETLREFCEEVDEFYSHAPSEARNNSRDAGNMLFHSCSLARTLMGTERKWEVICRVWVELLAYAAGHCRVDSHARLLNEGGEFITFVWLLNAHLGIGPHFPMN